MSKSTAPIVQTGCCRMPEHGEHSQELRTKFPVDRGRRASGATMTFFQVALLGSVLVFIGASTATACRNADNGVLIEVSNPKFSSGEPGKYNASVPDNFIQQVTIAQPQKKNLHFCVDVSILQAPEPQKAQVGIFFWGGQSSNYVLTVRDGQFAVVHSLFDADYVLVPWTDLAAIKKGIGQKNEIDFQATDEGADVDINGTPATTFIARPPSDDTGYGVWFSTNQTKASVFQFDAPRVFKNKDDPK